MGRKHETWQAPPETLAHMPEVSGNAVNGLGETSTRRASPFFWHEPRYQAFGEMQGYTLGIMYGLEDSADIARFFDIARARARFGRSSKWVAADCR